MPPDALNYGFYLNFSILISPIQFRSGLPFAPMKIRFLLLLPFPVLMLASCGTTEVTDTTGDDGPVFGRKDETKFVAGADGPVGLGDLARVAKTIRKYKNLGVAEQDIVKRVAELKLDGLVAREMTRLAPQFEKKKVAVRQQAQQKTAAVRRRAAASRQPAEAVAREVAAIETETTATIQQIDLEWKSAARTEVVRSYGSDFALPVQNPEGKAVVAFAKVSGAGISVSSAAYELEGTAGQLASAAAGGREISHENKSYALLNARVNF